MASQKTRIIESIFSARYIDGALTNPVVTLTDISAAIRDHNNKYSNQALSDRNPANFFKDLIRGRSRNSNWPTVVFDAGYSGRQLPGENRCFEFVQVTVGQTQPFPEDLVYNPTTETTRHEVESASMPLASRRLGRDDEPWLMQVAVRLRIIETYLALHSSYNVVQIDHLQMNLKLGVSEIDGLYLIVQNTGSGTRNILATVEAKRKNENILEEQIVRQVQAAFKLDPDIPAVIPMAIKSVRPSELYVAAFDIVSRHDSATLKTLTLESEAVYVIKPAIRGVGGQESA